MWYLNLECGLILSHMQLHCLNRFKSAHYGIFSGFASHSIIAYPRTVQDTVYAETWVRLKLLHRCLWQCLFRTVVCCAAFECCLCNCQHKKQISPAQLLCLSFDSICSFIVLPAVLLF
uniref:Uncharacterized protein n=1 Tax=Rhipicephalus zambeziensis TaxID=60191 RepID=A0A224Y5G2_9ACAR